MQALRRFIQVYASTRDKTQAWARVMLWRGRAPPQPGQDNLWSNFWIIEFKDNYHPTHRRVNMAKSQQNFI